MKKSSRYPQNSAPPHKYILEGIIITAFILVLCMAPMHAENPPAEKTSGFTKSELQDLESLRKPTEEVNKAIDNLKGSLKEGKLTPEQTAEGAKALAELEGAVKAETDAVNTSGGKSGIETGALPGPSLRSQPLAPDHTVGRPDTNRTVTESTSTPANAPGTNELTNVEFRMEGPVSRVLVGFRNKPKYSVEKIRSLKQVIVTMDNIGAPQDLQRAYDTTEFTSPISLFTVLQNPGSPPSTKIIIQLREFKDPAVTLSEGALVLDFPPPSAKSENSGEQKDSLGTEENIYASSRVFTGKKIDRLEIKNSDVQDVLRLIAKTSGYNIVVGDDVQGKVGTLSLVNVPWDQAFTLVLQSKKLGYVRQGNVIRVAALGTLKTEKEEALANEYSKLKVEPLRTVLIPISYAVADEISGRAKNFLTERGTLDVDKRTNTVIVKDIDRVITRLQKLFAALDTPPAIVSISARVVEMLSDFSRSIGFTDLSFSQDFQGVNLGERIQFDSTGARSITTISAPNFANLSARLAIGEKESKARILANPSVSVVANQTANITQTLSFFVKGFDIVNGAIVATSRQVSANLTLNVVPIVSSDGSIFLTLNVNNDIPRDIGSDNARVDARSVKTQILLENGDTAVLGGIFRNSVNVDKQGVPLLMRIPILSYLFSSSAVADVRNEIFVFVTAKILNPEATSRKTL